MKKKIITSLVLASLLLGLVFPLKAIAQPKVPEECCKLERDIEFTVQGGLKKFVTDSVVGQKGGSCTLGTLTKDMDTAGAQTCAATDLCFFSAWGMVCMIQVVYRVTNWLFYIMMIIVVVMAVAGGFVYMTASGDPEKAGKGKTIIIFAIVGMAIALLAKAIPSIVKLVVGM